jgi:hypothetical protein
MKKLVDVCEVEFSGGAEELSPEIIDAINDCAHPIRPVSADDVHVRAMFVTSDKQNLQGGRFDIGEIEDLCRLIPGAPVLIGHNKSRLPIARCFKADLVDRGGETWLKVWFYWLSDTEGADDLRRNIDGGIYRECSLAFSFRLPECSVCGGDIRRCSHVPGREYSGPTGEMERSHFIYRGITRVNEISLVYRGAVPGTAISEQAQTLASNRLSTDPRNAADSTHRFLMHSLGDHSVVLDIPFTDCQRHMIAFPHYSRKLLDEGRMLVGHSVRGADLSEKGTVLDSGAVTVLQTSDDGIRIRPEGQRLRGEYILRPAVLQNEKVVLLYRIW